MSRGKPLAVGPTANLHEGMTWDKLAGMNPAEIKKTGAFPYPSLPHPKQTTGGQVFPKLQIKHVPAAGALRRRLRHSRRLLARVPAGHLPAEPARAGRRVARRSRLDQQLPPAVQGHPHAGATRRAAPAADAAAAGGVQPDRRPQEPRSRAWASPASTATSTATPPASSTSAPTSARRSGASGWTPPACAACSTSRSTGRSAACARWKTSPSSSSGRPTSTATRSTP